MKSLFVFLPPGNCFPQVGTAVALNAEGFLNLTLLSLQIFRFHSVNPPQLLDQGHCQVVAEPPPQPHIPHE